MAAAAPAAVLPRPVMVAVLRTRERTLPESQAVGIVGSHVLAEVEEHRPDLAPHVAGSVCRILRVQ